MSSNPRAAVLDLASVQTNVLNMGNPSVQRVLLTAIDAAQGDFDRARAAIDSWFDSGMDRLSGWYKRSSQWVVFWVGLAIAMGLYVDAITIADFLYRADGAHGIIGPKTWAALDAME